MITTTNIDRIGRNAYAATLEDGLTEVMLGVFLCIVSGSMLTPFSGIAIVFLPALIMAVKKLKGRYTYPRTGYAEVKRQDTKKLLLGMAVFSAVPVALFITVFLLAGPSADTKALYRWMPVLIGTIMSGGMYATWKQSGLGRFLAYAILSPLAGAAVAMFPHEHKLEAVSLWALAMAVMFAVTGAWHLVRFLRTAGAKT